MDFFESLDADCWLMSPPCQPFTRGGNNGDAGDRRSTALLFLIGVLQTIVRLPRFLLVENVLNFEKSVCRDRLVTALVNRGYTVREYLISPADEPFLMPNNRLRYYLTATLPKNATSGKSHPAPWPEAIVHMDVPQRDRLPTLGDFLNLASVSAEQAAEHLVPEKFIRSCKNFRYDTVHPADTLCSTFTKAYGSHYVIGTGSFLQTAHLEVPLQDKTDHDALLAAKVRFFTPEEVARLQGFPATFSFPAHIERIKKYRLLGNSLNTRVVTFLLNSMFENELAEDAARIDV